VTGPAPADDRPHVGVDGKATAAGAGGRVVGPDWMETWGFDFYDANLDVAGWIQFIHHPASQRAAYASACIGPDRRLVVVVDPAIKIPVLKPSLEFRAEGIWAQHVCETPLEHWSVGLEAFGVALEDPLDALKADPWGDRIGVGYDLEWESTETTLDLVHASGTGFGQDCRVTGELLLADLQFDLDGAGRRWRAWGIDPLAILAELSPSPLPDPILTTPVRLDSPFGNATGGPQQAMVLNRQLDLSTGWSLRLTV
jgi:hypothetical protein